MAALVLFNRERYILIEVTECLSRTAYKHQDICFMMVLEVWTMHKSL
jgi:hypothetical protein